MTGDRHLVVSDWFHAVQREIEERSRLSHAAPSPGWALGRSLELWHAEQDQIDEVMHAKDFRRSSLLAAWGFLAEEGQAVASTVSDAISRLLDRDLFPADRNAFSFRPIELLGIARAISIAGGSEEHAGKIKDLREGLPARYAGRPRWEQEVAKAALSVLKPAGGKEFEIHSDDADSVELASVQVWKSVIDGETAEEMERQEIRLLKLVSWEDIALIDAGALPFVQFALQHSLRSKIAALLPTEGSVAAKLSEKCDEVERLKNTLSGARARIGKRCDRYARGFVWAVQISLFAVVVFASWKAHPVVAKNWERIEPYTWLMPVVVTLLMLVLNVRANAKNWYRPLKSAVRRFLFRGWTKLLPEITVDPVAEDEERS